MRRRGTAMMGRRRFLTQILGALTARAATRRLPSFPIRFTDVARAAGILRPTIFGGSAENRYILETTGCGVAFFDYDNDGWLDLFLVNGTTLEGAQGQVPVPVNRLYHNNRDGTFTDVTEHSGLARSGWGQGVCIGDYDNDGFDDLFITYWGQNCLYHNNGDGTFTDVTRRAGLHSPEVRWGSGCAFVDFDCDGKLDLFVANYINFDPDIVPLPGTGSCTYQGLPVNCGPRGLPKAGNRLYQNNGDGTFTDATDKSRISQAPAGYNLGVLTGDFNNDGWPDIYVANDTEPALLFWNNRDGTFTEGGLAAGVATNADGRNQSGMGVAAGDYNCDGLLDIFKTNFSDDLPNLYRNTGKGFFEEETRASGLGGTSRLLGWGCGFLDADNDGWPDIFYVNGHVYPEIDRLKTGAGYRQPKVLYQNLGNGAFRDVSKLAGNAISYRSAARGCAFGDFDNDGDIDIAVNVINSLPELLRCDSSTGNHWIKIKLVGVKSNRSAIGARVRTTTAGHRQMDEVRSGGSFYSQNDLRLHFGLGRAGRVDLLEIFWPSGHVDRLTGLAANQIVTIHEGQSRA
jgi:hypothetical protein